MSKHTREITLEESEAHPELLYSNENEVRWWRKGRLLL